MCRAVSAQIPTGESLPSVWSGDTVSTTHLLLWTSDHTVSLPPQCPSCRGSRKHHHPLGPPRISPDVTCDQHLTTCETCLNFHSLPPPFFFFWHAPFPIALQDLRIALGKWESCFIPVSVISCNISLLHAFPSSPIGEVFRARLRQFPSLVNCCTIDWFNEWPAEALQCVAFSFLHENPHLGASTDTVDGMVGATQSTAPMCAPSPAAHRQQMQDTCRKVPSWSSNVS